MRSKELFDILHNFNGFHPNMLYNDLIIIDGKDSEFTQEEQREFIVAYLLYQQNALTKKHYDRAISNIWKAIEKIDGLAEKLEGLSSSWLDIRGTNATPEDNKLKLYISVDNSDIHYFANKLISKSLEREYDDLDFKINNDRTINRRDNVVIYCNAKTFGKYIEVVEEILQQNPDLKLNNPHLLSTQYSEHIFVGMDPSDNKTSHTELISNALYKGLSNGQKPEILVQMIEEKLKKDEPEVRALAEVTSSKK